MLDNQDWENIVFSSLCRSLGRHAYWTSGGQTYIGPHIRTNHQNTRTKLSSFSVKVQENQRKSE